MGIGTQASGALVLATAHQAQRRTYGASAAGWGTMRVKESRKKVSAARPETRKDENHTQNTDASCAMCTSVDGCVWRNRRDIR